MVRPRILDELREAEEGCVAVESNTVVVELGSYPLNEPKQREVDSEGEDEGGRKVKESRTLVSFDTC